MGITTIRYKISKRYKAFKNHPLTRHSPNRALLRYINFNLTQTLFPGRRKFKWINGLSFYAQKGDAGIVPNIYYRLFDYEDSMFILNRLDQDDLMVDIGSNVGHFTLLSASTGAQVIAIEPIPATFEKLQQNITLNQLSDRVNSYMIGIGQQETELDFTNDRDVMNRVAAPGDKSVVKIPVRPLDHVLEGKHPKMLKIDVEGFELAVLKGATEVLKDPTLNYLLIELNNSSAHYGADDQQVVELIRNSGFYPVRYQVETDQLIPLEQYRKDKFNTLFVRDTAR